MNKLTIMLACGLLAAPASAQFIPQATAIPGSAPEGINYQGRLEEGGFPVNATKSMIFRVYSAPVAGVLLWTSPTQAVPVALGLFSAVVPVPTTVLVGGGARYLEVSIDGTLMSPRELLNSVPYALIAKSVEGNIDVSTAGLAINANSTAVQPALYISSVTGNVGVGTGAPITAFDVGGSAQFGSGTTKSTFSATGALNTAGKITAPDYTATYGLSAATASFSGSVRIIGELNGGAATTAGLFQLGAGPNGFDGARINLCGSANAACSGTGAAQYFTKGNGTADHSWYSDQGGGTVEKMRLTAPGSLSVAQGITASSVTVSHPIHTSALTANNGTMRTSIYQGAIGNQTAGAIGTDTNHPLCLYTAGSACQVKLDQSGLVYIATTAQPTSFASAMNIVHSANATEDGSGGVGLGIYSSFSNATVGRGGILGLGGVTSGMVGPAWNFATIYGFRENATPTNTAGYFGIATNPNGGLAIERMRITSTGNVGIGTASPATKLHLSSGTLTVDGTGARIDVDDSGNVPSISLRASGNARAAITASGGFLFLDNQFATGDMQFRLGAGPAAKMTLLAGGNVGIGTTAPATKLHMSSGTLTIDGTAGQALIPYVQVSSLTATTSIAAGGVTSQAAPVFTINNDPDTGMFSGSANNLGLTAGGNAFLLGDNGGNIQVRAPAGSNLSTVFTGGLPFAGGGSQVIVFNDGTVNTLSINSATGHGYFDTLRGTFNIRTGAAGTATQALSIGTDQTVVISTLTATYVGGSAHVCVNNAGQIFASEAACP